MTALNQDSHYPDYLLLKGLQKPLEFMGLQGRYIYWAAGTIVGTILAFIIVYCTLGTIWGLVTAVVCASAGAGLIIVKQRKGLHSKRIDNGVFIFAFSKRI